MRVKATDLLGYVEPIGEHGDLLRQSLVVDRNAVRQLANRGSQPVALFNEPRRRARGNAVDGRFDD